MPEFINKDFSNSSEMCDDILKKTGVALLPGSDFGLLPEKDLMGLLHSVNDLKINVICSDESAQKEFVRLTGKKPLATIQNFDVKEIKKVIQ